MSRLFLDRLDRQVLDLLRNFANAGELSQIRTFLVGGMIRDVLLGETSTDLDIMVEGDAKVYMELLFKDWERYFSKAPRPIKKVFFPRYKTGKLIFQEEILPGLAVIDFSSARKENYPTPGARPIISPGTLESDLQRRDYTVNALAVSLLVNEFGGVIDLFNGLRHLEERKLVLIHERSFEDDPARLLRGIRLISRHAFTFDEKTRVLFEQAVRGFYIKRITAERCFDEFRKALLEKKVTMVLDQLATFGLLQQIHEDLRYSEGVRQMILQREIEREVRAETKNASSFWQEVFVMLFLHLPESAFERVLAADFHLHEKVQRELLEIRRASVSHAS